MNRRDFIAYGSSSLALASLPNLLQAAAPPTRNGRTQFFYTEADIPRIRANAKHPLLADLYQSWKAEDETAIETALESYRKTQSALVDFRVSLEAINRASLIQIVEPTEARAKRIRDGITAFFDIDTWDFLQKRSGEIIGIQRASFAIDALLFGREVVWDHLDADTHRRLLSTLAEKACVPCFRAVDDMNNPEGVDDWIFTPRHADRYSIDMTRWPLILGANNLRAHPSSALGLGAIALAGSDDRSALWLETALNSCRRVMQLFNQDGSYFEGVSYADYTLYTVFTFFNAHQQTLGPVPYLKDFNLEGIAESVLTLQAGRKRDGDPDIVNFSDAKNSVTPAVPAWIAKQTASPIAQYVAENASRPYRHLDFLWFDPKREAATPPDSLKNVRNDLDWIICRSGWEADDAVLAFRSGGPANHEHADRNTFLYKYRGERLLNDPFDASYDWRHDAWPLRLTRGHNGLLIDGKGHHYHKGEEGTNDSLAYATILDFQDEGDHVWWTSDATSAYRLENEHVFRVLRSVYFAKPDTFVVLDQIQFRYRPQPVALRYFPENADGEARITIDADRFQITRPRAQLFAHLAASSPLTLASNQLDVDTQETGVYPFAEATCEPALEHQIVTVFAARPQDRPAAPQLQATRDGRQWAIQADHFSLNIDTTPREPRFTR